MAKKVALRSRDGTDSVVCFCYLLTHRAVSLDLRSPFDKRLDQYHPSQEDVDVLRARPYGALSLAMDGVGR
jgi:hypothetical protein